MLTHDPERLIEDEDLEEPQERAGSTDGEMPDDRPEKGRVPRETTAAPA